MTDTVFQKIIDKEIPTKIIHEDEHCIAFHDVQPQAPVHILVVPKKGITKLINATNEDQSLLGHLLLIANQVAKEQHIEDHFRLVINNGAKAGQSVFHLHLHILGDRVMTWPPG